MLRYSKPDPPYSEYSLPQVRKHAEWEPCALPPAASADSHAAAAGAEDAAARFTVERVLLISGNGAGGCR